MGFFPTCAYGLVLTGAVIFPIVLGAQSKESPSSTPQSVLNEQQEMGKGLYLQRCVLCHAPRGNSKDPKTRTEGQAIGPRLNSRMRGEKALPEAVVRTFIQKGVEGKMPGFQYGLEPKEIDALIAYLKTL